MANTVSGSPIRCNRCLIPNTRPDTAFVDGVCSACLSYERRPEIDWEERRKKLVELLDRHGGRCIVPSSGGKDSHYQVLTLLELGADITIVTASTCMLTEIGRLNIDNLSKYARTVEVTPNRTVRARLNRYGLEMVGDISWPEHASIFTTPFRMAVDLKIPLIFYGESPQNQYGGPPGSEDAKTMTRQWVSEFGGFLGLRPSDLECMTSSYSMKDYKLPSESDMKNVEAHFLGQYIPWNSHLNAAKAIAVGMQTKIPSAGNWWNFENLDNAQTGLHDFGMYLKYGFGRMACQLSVDIRMGFITREEAVKICHEFDGWFPARYMGVDIDEVLDHIGMTRDQLVDSLETFTNRDIFGQDWWTEIKKVFLKPYEPSKTDYTDPTMQGVRPV